MMASSARALRGRPGPLRSWSAATSTLAVVMASIVTEFSPGSHTRQVRRPSHVYQLDALRLGEPLRDRGGGRGGRALAGQPDERDGRAEDREDRGADGRVVHR